MFNVDERLEKVSEEEIYKLQAEELETRKELMKKRSELYSRSGLQYPGILDLMFEDI